MARRQHLGLAPERCPLTVKRSDYDRWNVMFDRTLPVAEIYREPGMTELGISLNDDTPRWIDIDTLSGCRTIPEARDALQDAWRMRRHRLIDNPDL